MTFEVALGYWGLRETFVRENVGVGQREGAARGCLAWHGLGLGLGVTQVTRRGVPESAFVRPSSLYLMFNLICQLCKSCKSHQRMEKCEILTTKKPYMNFRTFSVNAIIQLTLVTAATSSMNRFIKF